MHGSRESEMQQLVVSSFTDIKVWSVLKNNAEMLIFPLKSPLKLCQCKLEEKLLLESS